MTEGSRRVGAGGGTTEGRAEGGGEAGPGRPDPAGLRSRLPGILVEAAFVFLAVFLALVAEEWRENRDRRELAERALQGVAHEIEANRAELLKDEEHNRTALEQLSEALQELRQGAEPSELTVNYNVALTSTAAWETARMSQAVHFLDLGLMTELAELYEIQSLFERAQDDLVDAITGVGARMREDPRAITEDVVARIRTVMGYREILAQAYAVTLTEIEEH